MKSNDNNLVPHTDPPPSPMIGAPSQDEGEASNSGGAHAPAPLPISDDGRATLPRSPDQNAPSDPPLLSLLPSVEDRKVQLEALRLQIQAQHSENQKLLQSILEVEQASGWANHPAALNAVCAILSETKEFHSWLLKLQLNMTYATMHKKK